MRPEQPQTHRIADDSAPQSGRRSVLLAVIGSACRLPGGVVDGPSYWQLLTAGRDAVTEIPADRWNTKAFASRPGLKGKSASRWGGFLDQIDQFEPSCFGISPREAQYLDPQQRLLLETTFEALEQAGLPKERLAGSRTGVFVGVSTGDYGQIQRGLVSQRDLSPFTAQGCSLSIAANRISYCLDLRGPSFIVDTACSSSLVAFDRAAKSLREGESDLAVVGGVNIIINPETFISFSQASMLSPDGRCKAFDASANGFVRAEGGGAFILKRLDDALRDGDPIRAVVLGTGANQDGRTGGISMPNPDAQEALLREVYRHAGVDPAAVRYIEAHGTGTAVGDPSETEALGRVFGPSRSPDQPLIIGSCKTNLGHLEAASGIASLNKVLLMFEHRQIPPNLHFQRPNPHIPFDKHRLRVPTELEAWPDDQPAVIGINSFGFGGANAHVILGDPTWAKSSAAKSQAVFPHGLKNGRKTNGQATPASRNGDDHPHAVEQPLVLSARSNEALRDLAGRWVEFLKVGAGPHLADMAFTAAQRRSQYSHRLGLVAADLAEAREQLEAFIAGESRPLMHSAEAQHTGTPVAFVFCGQGPQWHRMGRELLDSEPVFRDVMEDIDRLLRPIVGWSLVEELSRDEQDSRIHRTSLAQPALFAIHVALARLWQSWGVEPTAVVGHSVGEIAAAHVAGLLSLESAVRVIGHRGVCLEDHALPGRMIAAALTEDDAQRILREFEPAVCLAAVNSPQMVTLAGEADAVDRLGERLTEQDVWWKPLRVRHAFHSHLVENAQEPFLERIGDIENGEPVCEMISTVTGEAVGEDGLLASYWWDNIRRPVRFADATRTLRKQDISVFLEIGPHPVLGASIKQCRRSDEPMPAVFASLVRDEPERRTMLAALGGLFTQGASIDWAALWPHGGHVVDLPRHPWFRERFWHENLEVRRARLQPDFHPLLGQISLGAQRIWQNTLDLQDQNWLQDHRAGGRVIFPASGFVELLLAAGARVLKSATVTIDDIGIQRGLFLQSDSAPAMQVTADASNRLTVASRMNETDEVWAEHLQATVRALPASIAPVPLDVDAWKADADPVSAAAFYDTFQQMDLDYGPAFRGVQELFRRDSMALGRIELPAELAEQVGDYLAHPALLDACFQVLLEATPPEDRPTDRMFLPERISRVYFHRSPGARAWSEVRLSQYSSMRAVGNIRVYTEHGEPALEIVGLECRAVISAKDHGQDVASFLYRAQWYHQPLPETPAVTEPLPVEAPVADLVASADAVARMTWHDNPPQSVLQSMARQNRLAMAYFVQALRNIEPKLRAGEEIDPQQLIESGRLIPRHRALVERCLDRLVTDGQAQKQNGRWVLTGDFAGLDPAQEWRDALAEFPELYPHLRLIEICGRDLPGVFAGDVDPLELLFSDESTELLEQIYRDQPWARYGNTFLQRLCVDLLARVPQHRPIRILEVGAGTGGTTGTILPALPGHRVEYWFTDVSPYFLSRAEDKFRRHEFVRYQRFDIEQGLAEQDIPPRAFDLVIAADVLHATGDVRASLKHCAELLTDGGMLALRELTHTAPVFDLVFGLTEGWWKHTSDEGRSESVLMTRSEWAELLAETGFEQPSTPATCDETEGYAAVIVARQSQRADTPPARITVPDKPPAEQNWLVFADQQGEGARLVDRLRQQGRKCVVVWAGESFVRISDDEYRIDPASREHMQQVVQESAAINGEAAIVHLWSADISGEVTATQLEQAEAQICHSLMHLLQSLTDLPERMPRRLVLVTRGARDLACDDDAARTLQGALIGLARVAANEYRQTAFRLIDLDPADGGSDALWAELVADDPQAEVVWRGPHRLVPRLESIPTVEPKVDTQEEPPFELHVARKGDLSSLGLREIEVAPPGPGEVQIDVHFVALNFRDILKSLGQYPAENPDQLAAGDECTGIVRAVGEGVTHVAPGDRVVACSLGCFRSRLTTDATRVMRIPDHLSLAAAVTMPVVYITAGHALRNVGRLAAGESVLIHSAAGGVGIAALNVAQAIGADIYATAGSDAKRELLAKFGVRQVMNSRTLDFYDELSAVTHGRGVDAVLNSLAGQAMARSLACLAEYGRFLELGKRDFYENTRIGLYPFRHNVSYHAVDLSALLGRNPKEGMALLQDMLEGPNRLPPLPMRVLPVARLQDGFRLMGQGVHIGKIVIDMTQHWGLVRRAEPQAEIRDNATYLVTGAFGGAGLEVARWLADRGAKHLVLLSRGGPRTDVARQAIETLQAEGVTVHTASCDVTDPAALEELLTEVRRKMPPLAGVFHLAMVLDDAALANLDRERFLKVTRPKAHGAWHLHNLTRDCPLDLFVLFSSVSATIGNFGQANYAAANAMLESLAAHRRRLGLPGTAVGWGVLGEVGYVAERQELSDSLEKLGFTPMSVADIRSTLDTVLAEGSPPASQPVAVAVRADWQKLGQRLRSTHPTSGLLANLVAIADDEKEAAGGIRESIAVAEAGERAGLMESFVKARVARVLGMSPQKTEADRALSEMGLDSLMAVELASIVEADLGVSLPVSALSRDVTIERLSALLLKTLFGEEAADPTDADSSAKADSWPQCVVPLREGGSGNPLFCFHPAGGELQIYESLTSRLAEDFPVYGLRRTTDDAESLSDLAAEYAAAITVIQPDGPVRLFGFSLGGLLAVHTASHLERRGREVEFVGVIECNPGDMDGDAAREDRLTRFICESYELVRQEMGFLADVDPHTLQEEARDVARRFDAEVIADWILNSGHISADVPRAWVIDYFTRLGQDLVLMANDSGRSGAALRVPLHLWSAADGMGTGIDVWRNWTAGECTHTVLDGEHFSVMYPPHVDELAAQLEAVLGRTEVTLADS